MIEDQVAEVITCEEHNEICKFIPPTRIDKKRRKLLVDFQCPMGHLITIERDLM